jgi:hypothetical protein
VRSRLTRGLSLLGSVSLRCSLSSVRLPLSPWFLCLVSYFPGVTCRFASLGGRVPLPPWVFCWDSYFCCSSSWGSTLSFFVCVSLVAVGKSGVVVFGRHCCCSVVPWCPLVVLLAPFVESLLSAPSYSAHVTFFVTPVCWLFLLGRVDDFSSSAVASCIWVSLLLFLVPLSFSCFTATLGLWVGLGT